MGRLAEALPAARWQRVCWREGVAEALTSLFAALRVRPVQDDHRHNEPRAEHWLFVEWPEDEPGPRKLWLSGLPEDTALKALVHYAKQPWLIERDYLELKQELGLGYYEGRGWRGFHHRTAICIAAYSFLVTERAALPPRPPAPLGWSKRLAFPRVTEPVAPPLKPERHVQHSIANLRRRIDRDLAERLPQCLCCCRPIEPEPPPERHFVAL